MRVTNKSVHKLAGKLLVLTAFALSIQAKAQIQFQDTTSAAGPFHTGESWGASWGDLNNDLYPDLYVSNHGMQTSIYKNNGDGTFTDVTATAVPSGKLTDEPTADIHGGTWVDYDNDGDDDLFVTRSSAGARVFLFQNNGNGVFTDVGGANGIAGIGGGRMVIPYDYDDDGKLDVSIPRNGEALGVYKRGTNNYSNTTSTVGIVDQCDRNQYGITARLFNNGNLIYSCMNLEGIPEHSYDTSTTPWTVVSSSIDHVGSYSDTAVIDLDNDGLQDLVATRGRVRPSGAKRIDSERIEAWLSISSGTDKSITFSATGPITVDLYSRKVASKNQEYGIYDKIFLGSAGTSPTSLPVTLAPQITAHHGLAPFSGLGAYMGYDPVLQEWTITLSSVNAGNEHVYFAIDGTDLSTPSVTNLGAVDGSLTPLVLLNSGTALVDSGARGMGSVSCGAIAAEDFDNDMDVDLYLVCRTSMENLSNRIYWNDGNGNFTLGGTHGAEGQVGGGILGGAGTGEMAVTADVDADGFMDIFVTNGNRLFPHFQKDGFSGGGADKIFINKADNGKRWLMFDLEGVQSNHDGFGTKVTVSAGGTTQLREQNGRFHRWSHDHRRLHFGMASNTSATVTVEWPNGDIDVHTNVVTNKIYKAVQNGTLVDQSSGGGTPELSINSVSIGEGGTATLTVTLSATSAQAVSVDYQTADVSATAGIDYSSKTDSLIFAANETSKTITVDTLQDTAVEADEVFNVVLSNPGNATLATSTGAVTINDDDTGGGGPTLSIGDVTVTEGGSAVFTMTLSQTASNNVTVQYQTVDGTATAASDYVARSGIVVFNPGDTVKTRTVMTQQDNLTEPDEIFTMTLTNPTNATLAQSAGTATIHDDDGGSQGTFCGQPNINTAVDRAIFLWKDCSGDDKWHVRAAAGGGSALTYSGNITTDLSFTGVTPFSIESNDTLNSSAQNISFGMTMGSTWQDGFDFNVGSGSTCMNLSAPTGTDVLVGASRTPVSPSFDIESLLSCQTGGGGGPTISISNVSATEGGSAVFAISLSAAASSNVTVSYQTVNGSAIAGSDYDSRSGKVVFSPGDTLKTRTVNILQDTLMEVDETFTMQLTVPVNGTLGQSSGTATIHDDDGGSGGSACGKPNFNTSVDSNLFLWKDCNGNGKWHVRATAGGGSSKTYGGNLTTNQTFSGVTPYSIEGSDTLTSAAQMISFNMTVGSTWQDGFDFNVATGNSCITMPVPSGETILVGAGRTPVTPPFDIETLGNCVP